MRLLVLVRAWVAMSGRVIGTPANLRHHFQRLTGTSPSTYRTAFRALVTGLTRPEREEAGSSS
ncbi:hypothetical protein [Streptomyces sp. NPDC058092]|uniref:hypothetical protein n=1 Tax=Streptomyces sp. NPDC058092 TaxID=3346336 RepID=UPI0036E00049